jgi:hypothetical protein
MGAGQNERSTLNFHREARAQRMREARQDGVYKDEASTLPSKAAKESSPRTGSRSRKPTWLSVAIMTRNVSSSGGSRSWSMGALRSEEGSRGRSDGGGCGRERAKSRTGCVRKEVVLRYQWHKLSALHESWRTRRKAMTCRPRKAYVGTLGG